MNGPINRLFNISYRVHEKLPQANASTRLWQFVLRPLATHSSTVRDLPLADKAYTCGVDLPIALRQGLPHQRITLLYARGGPLADRLPHSSYYRVECKKCGGKTPGNGRCRRHLAHGT